MKYLAFGGVFLISKYSKEFKLEVVKYYLNAYKYGESFREKFKYQNPTKLLFFLQRKILENIVYISYT